MFLALIMKLVSSEAAKELAVMAVEEVVKSTDNSIDDGMAQHIIRTIAKSEGNKLNHNHLAMLGIV